MAQSGSSRPQHLPWRLENRSSLHHVFNTLLFNSDVCSGENLVQSPTTHKLDGPVYFGSSDTQKRLPKFFFVPHRPSYFYQLPSDKLQDERRATKSRPTLLGMHARYQGEIRPSYPRDRECETPHLCSS